MKNKVMSGLLTMSIGLLTIGVGLFTFIDKSLPARLGEANIPLGKGSSFFAGTVVILCGLWFFYFAVKNFLKSRRLK